jgi:hypothetical protein
MQILKLRFRNLMHPEIIQRQASDFAGIGKDPDRAVTHRLRFGIAFAEGFVIVIELEGMG